MKVSILGAGGFIGSHIVETLLENPNNQVKGLDLAATKLDHVDSDRWEFVEQDIARADAVLDELVEWSDVVIDLVAYANPSLYVRSPLEVFELNFLKNLDIVKACVHHGRRLVQFSTSEIYGDPVGDRYDEDDSPLTMGPIVKQRWIYASAKQLLERVIHAYGLRGELDYTIFRPFNVIGPRLDYLVPAGSVGGPRVFAHFMSALLTGGPMYLVNGGTVNRTFTHIDDAVAGVVVTLDHDDAVQQAYNLGNPENEVSISGLAVMMKDIYRELTGRTADNEMITMSGEEFYGQGYEDTNRVPPNVDKLRALGWAPRHGLTKTVTDAIAHYIDNHDPAELRAQSLPV